MARKRKAKVVKATPFGVGPVPLHLVPLDGEEIVDGIGGDFQYYKSVYDNLTEDDIREAMLYWGGEPMLEEEDKIYVVEMLAEEKSYALMEDWWDLSASPPEAGPPHTQTTLFGEDEAPQAEVEEVDVNEPVVHKMDVELDATWPVPLDMELLHRTMSVQSHSRARTYKVVKTEEAEAPVVVKREDDEDMLDLVKARAGELAVIEEGVEFLVEEDTFGNIYITKGTLDDEWTLYPCVASHVDTVHRIVKNFKVFTESGVMFAMNLDEMEQTGIGGDDKVGVYVAFEMLRHLPVCKAVFFRDEEIGCLGSAAADMDFFDDCSMVLQADRRGREDFIRTASGAKLYSDTFASTIAPFLAKYDYKEFNGGLSTDVATLKSRGLDLCCANVSCGYYRPHSDSEVVVTSTVLKTVNMFYEMLYHLSTQRWYHKYRKPAPAPAATYTYKSGTTDYKQKYAHLVNEEICSVCLNRVDNCYVGAHKAGRSGFWCKVCIVFYDFPRSDKDVEEPTRPKAPGAWSPRPLQSGVVEAGKEEDTATPPEKSESAQSSSDDSSDASVSSLLRPWREPATLLLPSPASDSATACPVCHSIRTIQTDNKMYCMGCFAMRPQPMGMELFDF